ADGLRDFHVTGVQTCALPIYNATPEDGVLTVTVLETSEQLIRFNISGTIMKKEGGVENWSDVELVPLDAEFVFGRPNYIETTSRSEERRVGKAGRTREAHEHE